MADIFISYARANRDIAVELADDLTAQGYDVWWDTRLVGSDDYHHVLLEQLNRAKAVIVIWSDIAVKSRFVTDEAGRALNQNKLISTCLPDFDLTSLPLGFGGRHTDCVEERGKILEALLRFGWHPQKKTKMNSSIRGFELSQKEIRAVNFAKALYFAPDGLTEEAADHFFWAVSGGSRSAVLHLLGSVSEGKEKDLGQALQRRLVNSGHYHGSIDGIFGQKTIAAIKALAGED